MPACTLCCAGRMLCQAPFNFILREPCRRMGSVTDDAKILQSSADWQVQICVN